MMQEKVLPSSTVDLSSIPTTPNIFCIKFQEITGSKPIQTKFFFSYILELYGPILMYCCLLYLIY